MLVDKTVEEDEYMAFYLLQDLILVSGIKYSTFMSLLEFMYMGKTNCRLDAPTLQALFRSKFIIKKLVQITVMVSFFFHLVMNAYDMGGLQWSLSECFVNKTSEETALANISELGK